MLVLGAIVHREQGGGGGQALHEGVEEDLGLRVDPVQVLEDEEQGLIAAFAEEHEANGLRRQRAAPSQIELR